MDSENPLGPSQNTKPPDVEFVSPADLYRLRKLEQALNGAILKADIRFGPEHFVTAFNRFYDEQLEVRNISGPSLKGKQANLQRLCSFLTPIHVVVEVGAAELHCFEMEESWIEPDGCGISTSILPVRTIPDGICGGRRSGAGGQTAWCLRNTLSGRVFTWFPHGYRKAVKVWRQMGCHKIRI